MKGAFGTHWITLNNTDGASSHARPWNLPHAALCKSWYVAALCLSVSLFLHLPPPPRLLYSHPSCSVTHVAGGQGECGVFTGSKIYEQLKVVRRPASISAACRCQAGWGGLAVNHRRYTFISVFPSKREGYGKIMFYCCRISSAMGRSLTQRRHWRSEPRKQTQVSRNMYVCKSVCLFLHREIFIVVV